VGDRAAPVDEDADLTTDLTGQLRQLAGELVAHQPLRREATPHETLELADLGGFEAVGVAEYLDDVSNRGGVLRPI
jgi:hypothetical protein